jgi:uncharacterized protein
MSLGLTSKFSILQQSPHDTQSVASGSSTESQPSVSRWLPSRYTVRAATEQGSLVLWNTFTNSMSVFKGDLVLKVTQILTQRGIIAKRQGLIKFLADRGFIVSDEADEYRRLRYAFAKNHYAQDRLHLFLLSSEDCNFRCTYCYEDFVRGTMQPWVRNGVKHYLQKKAPFLKQLKVEWFGGEPLYGMEAIDDLAPFVLELAAKHGVNYISKMTTNAYLLKPEVLERLLAWRVVSYQITIDGPPEHHDRSRPGRDGSPTFEVIFNNLKSMQRRDDEFAVMLRVNFDRDNEKDLEHLLEMVERELHGDPRFRLAFRAVDRWGGPVDDQLNVCSPDETQEIQWRLRTEARRRGLLLSGGIYHAGGVGSQVCYATRPYSFIVGATGKIMKCTIDLDRNDRNVVGYINEAGELTLDDDKMALWTEPAFENDTKCQKCVILPACAGMSCPPIRWDQKESPCVPVRKTYKRALRAAAGDPI